MAWRSVGREARRTAFFSFPHSDSFDVLCGDCADIVDTKPDIRLALAIYTTLVYINSRREGTGIETFPRRQSGPAGMKEMHRAGAVAKQGKYNPAGRGIQSPERYRDALTCPETRVRFPRRPDSSKKIAPGWLKCRGNRCGRYRKKSRCRPHRHISAVRLGRAFERCAVSMKASRKPIAS